jgi:hypothetical protein
MTLSAETARWTLEPEHSITGALVQGMPQSSFNSILLHLSGNNVDRGPTLTTDRDDGQTIRQWRAGGVSRA